MSKAPAFYLTRNAALDLRNIYDRSRKEWGEKTASIYISDLYAAMNKAAANPDTGLLRQYRAVPFLIVPSRQHYIIYDRIPEGIAILAILHQARDIESLVAGLSANFLQEVEKLKTNKKGFSKKPSNNKR